MLLSWALLALWLVAPLAAQDTMTTTAPAAGTEDGSAALAQAAGDSLVGAAVSVGSRAATLDLELSNGRTVQLGLENGQVSADGEILGRYDEGDALERSWRDLLEEAAMASTAELPILLRAWSPPAGSGDLGARLDERIEQALEGVGGRMHVASGRTGAPGNDSVEKLVARIRDLERRESRNFGERHDDNWDMPSGLRHFLDGVGSFFGALIWFGVLFGVGAALLFFGDGRIERVGMTVRSEPLRAALIGLAGAFLAIPFYVLVILALVISIIGIPLVIAWAPLFPVLVALAGMAGWLAVAYAAGEKMVSRKLHSRRMFRDAGGFHHLAVGILLLLSPFILGALFEMTVILGWLGDLLIVLGLLANMLVSAMGFGAVLMRTRAGIDRHRERRAAEKRALVEQNQEGTNV